MKTDGEIQEEIETLRRAATIVDDYFTDESPMANHLRILATRLECRKSPVTGKEPAA